MVFLCPLNPLKGDMVFLAFPWVSASWRLRIRKSPENVDEARKPPALWHIDDVVISPHRQSLTLVISIPRRKIPALKNHLSVGVEKLYIVNGICLQSFNDPDIIHTIAIRRKDIGCNNAFQHTYAHGV